MGEEKWGREARDAEPLEPSLHLGADICVAFGKYRVGFNVGLIFFSRMVEICHQLPTGSLAGKNSVFLLAGMDRELFYPWAVSQAARTDLQV